MPTPFRGPVPESSAKARRTRPSVALAAVLLAAGLAAGQTLDLSAPAGPPPGVGPAAATLAEDLRARVEHDRPRIEDNPRVLAASALRELASALILRGEQLGEAGAAHTLAGRTLAARLGGFEDELKALAVDDATIHVLAADAQRAAAAVPADVTSMDRLLRDTLASVLGRAQAPRGPFGWVDAPDAPPAPDTAAFGAAIPRWSSLPGVTPEAAEQLARHAEMLRTADRWASYRRSSEHLRSLIRRAAATFDPEAPGAAVTSEPARMQFAITFSGHIEQLADARGQSAAMAGLERLATAGDALELLSRLEVRADRARRHAPVVGAVVQALASPGAEPAQAERRIAALHRVLRMILVAEESADESHLIRQLRPAHRALTAAARKSAAGLFDALPRIAQDPRALTDPGILSALASHRRTLDDLALIDRLGASLRAPAADGGAAPAVMRGMERIADGVLELGQALSKPAGRDAALAAIRRFGEQFPELRELPGEPALIRAATDGAASANDIAFWNDLTGSQHAQLAEAIETHRQNWLREWTNDPGSDAAAEHAERLRTLHGLMVLIDAVRTLDGPASAAQGRGMPRINAWPGWELSQETLHALLDALRAELSEATAAALGNDATGARQRVESITQAHAAVLLIAELERRAVTMNIGGEAGGSGLLWELGSGGPYAGRAWLWDLRLELAQVARAAEEWAAAVRSADESTTGTWGAYLNTRSEDILGRLTSN